MKRGEALVGRGGRLEAAVKRVDPRSRRQAGERSALVGRGGRLEAGREARGPPLSEAGWRAVGGGGPGRSRGAA